MADCLNCRNAMWKLTAAGKLHPSGDGRCGWVWEERPIPAAFYYVGGGGNRPSGGYIDRKRLPAGDCPFFQAKVA